MSIKANFDKAAVIKDSAIHKTDTGSVNVQVSVLTARITYLTEHLKQHRKDYTVKRSLIQMIAKRLKLLNYLRRIDSEGCTTLVQKLGIRFKK